jgi:predicted DsbA family dithiol-disulfide isomerase
MHIPVSRGVASCSNFESQCCRRSRCLQSQSRSSGPDRQDRHVPTARADTAARRGPTVCRGATRTAAKAVAEWTRIRCVVMRAGASGAVTSVVPASDISFLRSWADKSVIRQRAGTLLTFVLVLCALASTAHLLRSEFARRSGVIALTAVQDDWRLYADDGYSISDSGAGDTVVVFTDYQCPFCRSLESVLDSVRTRGTPLHVVYRQSPSRSHPFAVNAVRAVECAAKQNRFAEMHRALFLHGDSLGRWPLRRFAIQASLVDTTAFDRCVSGDASLRQFKRDSVAAARLKIRGTPSVLVGRVRYNGLPSADSISSILARGRDR